MLAKWVGFADDGCRGSLEDRLQLRAAIAVETPRLNIASNVLPTVAARVALPFARSARHDGKAAVVPELPSRSEAMGRHDQCHDLGRPDRTESRQRLQPLHFGTLLCFFFQPALGT